jgi:hypothetical protein
MNEQVNIPKVDRFNGISMPRKWNGLSFRSTLEARWAIFFDSLNPSLPYEYEPELIATPWGPYLPDFWLPTIHTFWIVKGQPMDEREQKICEWLLDKFGVFIAEGKIPKTFEDYEYSKHYGSASVQLEDGTWIGQSDWPMFFCQSHNSGRYGVQWSGCWNRIDGEWDGDRTACEETDNIRAALHKAADHRFDRR